MNEASYPFKKIFVEEYIFHFTNFARINEEKH